MSEITTQRPNDPTIQHPNDLTIEERVAALEARMSTLDGKTVRVPKWALWLALGAVVLALILMMFTLPASPLAQSPTVAPKSAAAVVSPAPTACPFTPAASSVSAPEPTLAPLGIASASRTLGNPHAQFALVEYGDFQ